ncbi:DUF3265 domain-containing protein [Pseudoalteromonas xiamenensis]|uniref:DUF3265 domain-containing protein n=1 Tax=Pseudoalteromonas xiamenensis TaxID=882626 RepID=A0A975DJY1_9GAMM|nr:DUF3265 domain-containing protein [Pseudoalteromonas xiamenensis]
MTNASRRIRNAWHFLSCVEFSDLGGVQKQRIALLTT